MPLQNALTNTRQGMSISQPHRRMLSNSGAISPPLGVRSMLKTTTELGDISLSRDTPTRIADTGPRLQSTRRRSGSFDSSFASALRHRHSPRNRPGRERNRSDIRAVGSRFARHNSVQSSLTSYLHAPRSRQSSAKNHHNRTQDLASSGFPAHVLHNHRSLMTLRSYGDNRNRYSPSPSIHSTSTHVSFHRVLPPANRFKDTPWYGRATLMNASHCRSAASSPASTKALHWHPSYGTNTKPFVSSSTRLPSPTMLNRHSPVMNGRHSSAPGAPVPIRARAVDCKSNNALARVLATPMSSNTSRTPLYYDYSESYVEEDYFSPNTRLLNPTRSHSINQVVLDSEPTINHRSVRTPLETKLGSALFPAELPTSHNLSIEKYSTPFASEARPWRESSTQPASVLLPNLVELPANVCWNLEQPRLPIHGLTEWQTEKRMDCERASHENVELEVNTRCFSAASRRSRASSTSGIFFLNGEKSQRNLAALVAQIHSPASGVDLRTKTRPQVSTGLISEPERTDLPSIKVPCAPDAQWFWTFPDPCLITSTNEKPQPPPLYAPQKPLEVLSPKPERPVSAQSRKQFCKIIEADDNTEDVVVLSGRGCHSPLIVASGPVEESMESNVPTSTNCRTEQLLEHGKSPRQVAILNGMLTPRRKAGLSLTTSHGKSTVDLLLERHIEALDLMPEFTTPSDFSEECSYGHVTANSDNKSALEAVSEPSSQLLPYLRVRPSTSSSCPVPTLGSDTQLGLKPQRLFASLGREVSAFPQIVKLTSCSKPVPTMTDCGSPSLGWQFLPSDSQAESYVTSSKPTLMSGEMADIDTNIYPLGCRIWRSSQLSLPTSVEEQMMVDSPQNLGDHYHRRSRSEDLSRQESRRRRRIRVRMKRRTWVSQMSKQLSDTNSVHPVGFTRHSHEQRVSLVPGFAELDGDQPMLREDSNLIDSRRTSSYVPTRWSSIMAAMPMPGTGMSIFPRKVSTRTQRSQRSNRSRNSVVEPLNSTRQRSQVPRLGSTIPRLAPPDLGPPLDTSTLHLSIPYAEAPSTIRTSLCGPRSFFEDSPTRSRILQQGVRRQFGLRPLRSAMQGARTAPPPVATGLPTRNGVPIAAIGPFSPPMKTHSRRGVSSLRNGTTPSSEFTYRKAKVFDRFKGWWRRQCVQKAIATRKGRASQPVPNGTII